MDIDIFSLFSQVGSRFVMQLAGIILIIMAILGRVGAVFCLIPEPIIGGLATISLGAVFGEYKFGFTPSL